jgi:hypothetical protein
VAAKKTTVKPGAGDASIAASVDAALKQGASSAAPPEGTRVTLTLSAGAIHLLDTAVLVDGMDRSGVAESLINTHLAGYYAGKPAVAPV